MKYRIKIKEYANGEIVYIPQVKRRFFWRQIGHDGDPSIVYDAECSSKEDALKRMKKHELKNWVDANKVKSIKYEKIN